MKVLFLDFDGVLNEFYPNNPLWSTENPNLEEISEIHRNTSNFIYNVVKKHYEKSDTSPPLYQLPDLDCDKISHLNSIVKHTNCKIIFSTSWRGHGVENLAFLLTLKGFDYPHSCIGKTDTANTYINGKKYYSVRGLEIKKWLEENTNIESFAILDDESFDIKDYYKEEFIQVKGLTERDANDIINLLNKTQEKR